MDKLTDNMWAEEEEVLQWMFTSPSNDMRGRRSGGDESYEWMTEAETTRVDHPIQEQKELEGGPAIAAAGLGFEILKSTVVPIVQGDIQVVWPTSPIGVRCPGKPPGLQLEARRRNGLILNYVHAVGSVEQVNVKLRCYVVFNGPEVEATFSFDAEGRRSRLGRDTYVTINNPLSLETQPAPADWQKVGVPVYPVVRIPVEFRVDHPWPRSNYNETFILVLSGMYGFGASLSDPNAIKDQRVVYN